MRDLWNMIQGMFLGAFVMTFVFFPLLIVSLYIMSVMLRWAITITGI